MVPVGVLVTDPEAEGEDRADVLRSLVFFTSN